MRMLTCEEVLANLSNYFDDECSAELRAQLEDHISKCRRCRVVFDSTGKMLKILVDVEPFEVPLAVSARLYSRLQEVLSEE
jgi:predicted anti-sigma-YlaC factor YlaD